MSSQSFIRVRFLVMIVGAWICGSQANADQPRFPPLANADANLFREAIGRETPRTISPIPITGVTVPHHLLAADLIARGIAAARGNQYERIILLSPDHFSRSRRPIATTRRGFDTVLGPVPADVEGAEALLAHPNLVDDSELFEREHGVTAVLPFLAEAFPGVPVLPVALSIASTSADWDATFELIRPLATRRTLVVQSTDFSHHLRPGAARTRDQETLAVLATGDAGMIRTLHQSNHVDSKASLYVQLRLQQEVFGSSPVVIANRNSSEYMAGDLPSTSYVVMAFSPDQEALSRLSYPDQERLFFGGDVFLGRFFAPVLTRPEIRDVLIAQLLAATQGAPLVVNLEGVLMREVPLGVPEGRHVMLDGLTGPLLEAARVRAASLANNHSLDLGPAGLAQSARLLAKRGIVAAQHMQQVDLGAIRLLAINLIGSGDHKRYPAVRLGSLEAQALLRRVCRMKAKPPLVAFLHWGEEYTDQPGAAERIFAGELGRCGVSLVVGAHSHRASRALELTGDGSALMKFSLGNLMFDQRDGTGVLLELRRFRQGTLAVRLVNLPNLYTHAVAASGARADSSSSRAAADENR